MALHSLPHFRSLMFPPGSFLLRYPTRPPEPEGAWFPKPSASASAGPAGCTERAVPGNPRSAPPPHVPGAVAASAGHEGKTPQQAPPDSPTSRPGPWTRTPTRNSPPGRKQEGGRPRFPAPPTGRLQPGSGLRKLRAQFPAAPLLRGSLVLDFQDARRGGRGGAGVSGERQVGRRGVVARAGLWLGARVQHLLPVLAGG